MRKNFLKNYFISVALIRHFEEDKAFWLGHWDGAKEYYDFVTSERLEHESFRESVIREVAWKLDLNRDRDFLVSNIAQISTQFVGWLPDAPAEMNIAVAFYPIHLYGNAAESKIEDAAETRWLTSGEICQGRTHDDLPLNPQLVALINRTRVIQHWE